MTMAERISFEMITTGPSDKLDKAYFAAWFPQDGVTQKAI
jgi:hypothetical protein